MLQFEAEEEPAAATVSEVAETLRRWNLSSTKVTFLLASAQRGNVHLAAGISDESNFFGSARDIRINQLVLCKHIRDNKQKNKTTKKTKNVEQKCPLLN